MEATRIEILLIFSVFFACNTHTQAQNLVPNHSFEESTRQDEIENGFQHVVDWGRFLTCDYHYTGYGATKPEGLDYYGYQEPFSGDAMAGIRLFDFREPEWHEYISTKLIEPLINGETYFVSLRVSPSEAVKYISDDIGVRISNSPQPPYHGFPEYLQEIGLFYEMTPQIFNPEGHYLDNAEIWHEISGYYTASEGDEYIIIGNFKSDSNTTFIKNTDQWVPSALYFIDEVVVQKCIDYPSSDLPHDTVICEGETIALDVYWPDATYSWSTGAAGPSIEVSQPGKYEYQVFKNGCVFKDTILVHHLTFSGLGSDVFLCDDSDLRFSLDATVAAPGARYYWNAVEGSPVNSIDEPGIHWVEVSAGACSIRDTVNVSLLSSRVLLSPNPNNGRFTVSFDQPFFGRLNFYDIFGREVFTREIDIFEKSYPIDLGAHFAAGLFILEVKMEGCAEVLKFVIVR
jgi:hypothetical protein